MRITFSAALLLATCSPLVAADLALAPLYKAAEPAGWNGFYLGFNAGGGVGDGRSDFSMGGAPGFASIDNALKGAVGGIQAGYNWQAGMAVVGLETDFQAASLNGSLTAPCLPGVCGLPLSASYSQQTPWFGTVRARLGVATGGWLIYATGGYAYARLETDASATAGAASASATLLQLRNGWSAGGGIEVAVAPCWSVKLEYLYLDFGKVSTTWVLAGGLPAIIDDARFNMNIVRAGVNYRF
jgi:opacity protein-like surface antigen